MDKLCIVIEKTNWKREVRYSDEKPERNFWIREWHYARLSSEKIDEIERSTLDRLQEILKDL
jgi:dTDP-4-dehydrorhamnose reductase